MKLNTLTFYISIALTTHISFATQTLPSSIPAKANEINQLINNRFEGAAYDETISLSSSQTSPLTPTTDKTKVTIDGATAMRIMGNNKPTLVVENNTEFNFTGEDFIKGENKHLYFHNQNNLTATLQGKSPFIHLSHVDAFVLKNEAEKKIEFTGRFIQAHQHPLQAYILNEGQIIGNVPKGDIHSRLFHTDKKSYGNNNMDEPIKDITLVNTGSITMDQEVITAIVTDNFHVENTGDITNKGHHTDTSNGGDIFRIQKTGTGG